MTSVRNPWKLCSLTLQTRCPRPGKSKKRDKKSANSSINASGGSCNISSHAIERETRSVGDISLSCLSLSTRAHVHAMVYTGTRYSANAIRPSRRTIVILEDTLTSTRPGRRDMTREPRRGVKEPEEREPPGLLFWLRGEGGVSANVPCVSAAGPINGDNSRWRWRASDNSMVVIESRDTSRQVGIAPASLAVS